MNVMTKFTLKSLKSHKVRTLVTIAGVVLAAALFTAVLACVTSLNGFLLRVEVATSGDWTADVYTDTLDEALAGLENDSAITDSFIYTDVGFAAQPQEAQKQFGTYLCVESTQGSWPLVALKVEEGRFPENGQEIMLPTRFMGETLFGVEDVGVGSVLNLEVGDRQLIALEDDTSGYTRGYGAESLDGTELDASFDLGDILNSSQPFVGSVEDGSSLGEQLVNEAPRTYTVVGFYYDGGFGGLTGSYMYAALTREDPQAQGFSTTYVKTTNLNSRDDILANLESAFDSPYVFLHDSYLRYLGIVSDRSLWTSLEHIALILGVIIAVACVVLVSNSFAISVTERIKQFGLLASLGATKRQLAWSVIEEALVIALIGVPLGILVGLGATAITLHFLGASILGVLSYGPPDANGEPFTFSLVVNGWSLGLAALVTVLVVLISATVPALRAAALNPIDAIRDAPGRSTKKNKTSQRAAQKPWSGGISRMVFGVPGKIAALNTQRSKGKNIVVSLSLALALVLLMTGGVVSATFGTLVRATHLESNYDILVVGGVEDVKTNEGVLAESYDEMASLSEVQGLGWSLESPLVLTVSPEMIGPEALSCYLGDDLSQEIVAQATGPIDTVSLIAFVDDENYRVWLEENGIDPRVVYDALDQGKLAAVGITEGYGENGNKYMLRRLFRSTGETDAILPGQYASGENTHDFFYDYRNGVLSITGYAYDDNGIVEQIPFSDFEHEAMPLDVVALAAARPQVMNQGSDTPTVVAPMSALCLLPASALSNDGAKFRAAFKAEDNEAAYEAIDEITTTLWKDTLPGFSPYIDNVAQRAQSNAMLAMVVNVFCLLFTGVLMLIALASLFTTITNNFTLRAREFAVLQSIGMDPKAFRRMITAECVGYSMRGFIPGMIVSFFISLALTAAISGSVGGLTYTFPWGYALFAVVLIALLMVVSVAYGMHCLKAQTPAEILSGE